jgi:sugar-specific transcriptional regulator TrmB
VAAKAGLQRTNFYDLLPRLVQLGLIKQSKRGGKQVFYALNPDDFFALEAQRLEQLRQALPELKAISNAPVEKPHVFFYEGAAGVKQVYDNMLRHRGEIVMFTTPSFVSKEQLSLLKDHVPQRVALGNRLRMIGEVSPENMMLKKRDEVELRETRLLSKDQYHSNVEIGIYGKKVYIADYRQLFGMEIESSDVASTLRMIFELTWNSGKIVDVK